VPDLSNALQECLTALDEQDQLQDVLRRYPDDRDELIALLRLSVDVAALSAEPADPAFRLRARNAMLAEAARRRERRRWNPFVFLPRPAIVAGAAGLALVAGGLTTAAASNSSLPGDPLYGIKLTLEKAQLATTFDTAARAQLQLQFADVRLDEAQRLFAAGRVQDGVRLVDQYDAEVAQFKQSIGATSLNSQDVNTLSRIVDDRQSKADARLAKLAGSLAANGESEAAAAVTRTESRVDEELRGSRQDLQAHSSESAPPKHSPKPAPTPGGEGP
jgi:Domain of unknown function (DUF5667)